MKWFWNAAMRVVVRRATIWPSNHAGNEIMLEQLKHAHTTVVAIHEAAGAVCPQYETCEHPSCQASYAAWAIADQYLQDA